MTATGDLRQIDDRLEIPSETDVVFAIRSGSAPTVFRALVLELDHRPPRRHESE